MRTTITLEDDVAAALKRPGKQRGFKFKTLLNHALREGIKSLTGPTKKRSVFRPRSINLGSCRAGNVDNVAEVLAVAEGKSFN